MNRRRLFQAAGIGAATPVLAKLSNPEAAAVAEPTGVALVGETGEDILWLPDNTIADPRALPGHLRGLSITFEDYGFPGGGAFERRYVSQHGVYTSQRQPLRMTIDLTIECYGHPTAGELEAIFSQGLQEHPNWFPRKDGQ